MIMKTDGEQIVAMQTQMVVIQDDIREIKTDIKSILANLAATSTQNALLHNRVINLETEIFSLKKKEGLWSWLKPTLAAAAGATLTFLLINFLQNSK